MLAAIRGDPVDSVPLDLAGFTFQSQEAIDACPDPLRRQIARRVFSETAYFRNQESYVNMFLVTPGQRIKTTQEDLAGGRKLLTGRIDTPKGVLTFTKEYNPFAKTWWQAKYPVESFEDIERIRSVPWELPEGLAPPDGSHLTDGFAERGILQTMIGSPVARVAAMMNYEWFLELVVTEPELIAELTEICRRRILDILGVLLSKPGIEYVRISGSELLTPPMASPVLYDALVQEPEKSLIRFIHDQGDIVVHVHCHGRMKHALTRSVERGVDYTEPVEPPPDGDISMAEARRVVNGRMALGGNMECRVLCNESQETVEKAARAAFEGGRHRFVLRPTEGPSPELTDNEFRNYMRMVDVWEELSPMD
jgi:hypothetical protein